MNIQDYKSLIEKVGFEEFPFLYFGGEKFLPDFIPFEEVEPDLKIYLAKYILCRSFPAINSGIFLPQTARWFITNFLASFDTHFVQPWQTYLIKEAIAMIMADNDAQRLIATTFMFGVIESYAKYKLGYEPHKYDFFDEENHRRFKEIDIGAAIFKLKKLRLHLAASLNQIDKYNIQHLKENEVKEERWVKAKIADRITQARNAMVHGQNHGFHFVGQYLIMLYILFHFHEKFPNL